MVLVEEHTASSSTELDFTTGISALFDTYVIEFVNVLPVTNAVDIWLQVSTNGGSSYDSSAHYSWSNLRYYSASSGLFGNTADTKMVIVDGDGTVANTGIGCTGELKFYGPLSGNNVVFMGQTVSQPTTLGSSGIGWQNWCIYTQTTPVNAFRILASSGNLASGTVRLYGIAH
jgi:hypothetical protein